MTHANAALNAPEQNGRSSACGCSSPGEAMDLDMRLDVRPNSGFG